MKLDGITEVLHELWGCSSFADGMDKSDPRVVALLDLIKQACDAAYVLHTEYQAEQAARFIDAAENAGIALEVKRNLCRQRLAEQGIVPHAQNKPVNPDGLIPPELLIKALS